MLSRHLYKCEGFTVGIGSAYVCGCMYD